MKRKTETVNSKNECEGSVFCSAYSEHRSNIISSKLTANVRDLMILEARFDAIAPDNL